MRTYSICKALDMATELAVRTLSAALIYQNEEGYLVTQCPIRLARILESMQGTAQGVDGRVISVIYH